MSNIDDKLQDSAINHFCQSIDNKTEMHSDDLPPVLLNANKRYMASIPEGKLAANSPSEIPVVGRRGSGKMPISMRELMADSSLIDMKLKSLSHNRDESRMSIEGERKERGNMKFLKYKFNPGSETGEGENLERGQEERYGQLGGNSKQKISINTFYEHKNVLFQDERAPLVYKRLFLEREEAH